MNEKFFYERIECWVEKFGLNVTVLGTKLSQHSWQAVYSKYLLVTVNSDIVILYAKYFTK